MPVFGPTGGTGPVRADDTGVAGGYGLLYDQDLQLQFFVDNLHNATPDQIRTFVQSRIIDLPSAQTLLTMMALWIARAGWRTRSNNL